MPRKSYTIDQIISKLREAEVLLSQGQTVGNICRSFNISEYTYSLAEGIRWDPYRSSAPAEGTREREYPTEEASGRTLAGQRHIAGDGPGKPISPARRRNSTGGMTSLSTPPSEQKLMAQDNGLRK